jgi:ParB-like chromosome segregation protein Spo0J
MDDHPIAAGYPAMTPAEYRRLLESIKNDGLEVPIVRYEGKILDGRHRYRACVEAGVEPRFEDFEGTAEEACAKAGRRNDDRRHESEAVVEKRAAERRKRVAAKNAAGMSERDIAEEERVSQTQVRRDLKAVSGETPVSPDTAADPEKEESDVTHEKAPADPV